MRLDKLEEKYGSINAAIAKLKEELRPKKDLIMVRSYVVSAHYRKYPARKRALKVIK